MQCCGDRMLVPAVDPRTCSTARSGRARHQEDGQGSLLEEGRAPGACLSPHNLPACLQHVRTLDQVHQFLFLPQPLPLPHVLSGCLHTKPLGRRSGPPSVPFPPSPPCCPCIRVSYSRGRGESYSQQPCGPDLVAQRGQGHVWLHHGQWGWGGPPGVLMMVR